MKKRIIIGGRGSQKNLWAKKITEELKQKRISQNDQSKNIANSEEFIEFVTNSFYEQDAKEGKPDA